MAQAMSERLQRPVACPRLSGVGLIRKSMVSKMAPIAAAAEAAIKIQPSFLKE